MITVSILFTENSGDPATGLTLNEIDLFLWRRRKADGLVQQLWNATNPTEEIGGGLYTRAYSNEDWSVYDYFASAQYTGAVVLDSDWSLQGCPACRDPCTLGAGAIAFPYCLISTADSAPVADASVWITTDAAGANIIASGLTDSSGNVTFYLDAGTYYVWRAKSGWTFDNPETRVVS